MQFINKTSLSEPEFLLLTNNIPKTTSLMDLISWCKKKNAPVLDLVKLDEYTFDVILGMLSLEIKQNKKILDNLFLIPDVT